MVKQLIKRSVHSYKAQGKLLKFSSLLLVMRQEIEDLLLKFQCNEITEYNVYLSLASRSKGRNKEILERIAKDELRHYSILKKYTGRDVEPNAKKILLHSLTAKIFGVTFTIKLMERGERIAQEGYHLIMNDVPEAAVLLKEEEDHESELIDLIKEERVEYVGSMVLGLNDALVELTGALAGLSLALQNSKIVGMAGLIMGIAASLSMAASEYLSRRSEGIGSPLKGAFYTGLAYIIAVSILIAPFFSISGIYSSLAAMFLAVVIIIAAFTFYVSVVKDQSYKKLFAEMIGISLGVSAASFIIGWAARILLGIEI